MLRRALLTPPGPIRFHAFRPLIRRPEDPHPIEPSARKQLDPVDRSVSARPGSLESVTRRPRPPPNRFTRRLPGPWTFPSIGIPTRWADRPKAATPRTVPPKGFPAHRPFRLHASRSDGRGPEGFRPAGPFRPKASWPARPFRPRASGSHGAQSEDRIPRRHG